MTESLIEIIERSKQDIFWAVKSCKMVALWDQVVDERVSRNTEAVKLRNKVLYVNTATSTWAQELTFLKRDIIRHFNEKAGEEAVKDIKFKAAGERIGGKI